MSETILSEFIHVISTPLINRFLSGSVAGFGREEFRMAMCSVSITSPILPANMGCWCNGSISDLHSLESSSILERPIMEVIL